VNTIKGRIIAIQEERFRLLSAEGQGYLLTLSKHASTQPQDLERWRKGDTLVEVRYRGQPNLETGVAWSVWPV